MIRFRTWPVIFILVSSLAMAFLASPAKAMSLAEMKGLVEGETDQRIETLNKVVARGDENTLVFLQALADDAVKVAGDKIWIVRDTFGAGKALDPLTGQKQDLPAEAQDVVSNNRFRSEIETALAALKLFSSDLKLRQQAVKALLKEPDASKLPILNKALAQEQDPKIQNLLQLAKAAAQLGDADVAVRLVAAQRLAESQTPETQLLLNQRLQKKLMLKSRRNSKNHLQAIESALKTGERLGALFTGVSLGSILLLVALGLAITYGLMGVINMAHGELMMIGAYATYVVQVLFRQYLPSYFDAYLVVAVPLSFLASALVGAFLEERCCVICMAAHLNPCWPHGASALF
jgi:urea transport system permease protein